MKKLLYILIPIILLVLTVAWLRHNKEVSTEKVYHYNKEQPILVDVDTLALQPVAIAREYTGSFEPNRETKISSDVPGKILKYYVDAGSYVRRGAPLVKLDDDLLQLQLRSVQVQIKSLEADVRRYTVLVAADAVQGVQLEKSQIALESAQVQRSTILEQIRKTTIAAPFDGVVTQKMSEVGAFAAPGVPLVQLTDIHLLRFTVQVPEADLPLFGQDQGYRLRADQYPQWPLNGRITLIGSKGNGANLFPVQFTVNNTPDWKIKAGMFGKVQLRNKMPVQGILIPSSAIVGSDVQPQVYTVEGGKAVLKSVILSQRISNEALVASGLQPGNVLITGGFINLSDGAPVRIK